MRVLAVNCGSSSLKFTLFDVSAAAEAPLAIGAVEGLGTSKASAWLADGQGQDVARTAVGRVDHRAAIAAAADQLARAGFPRPEAVGHRIVFGGDLYVDPTRLTGHVIEQLRALSPFAPLHLPAELSGVDATASLWPGIPQVACFDTAFHSRMPARVRRLPLPAWVWTAGIRRYGFHGLSYEFVVEHVGAAVLGRGVIAHLGHGASLAAVQNGRSIDTTMGLTPTGGIMMSTRSGDLDPGVLVHLATAHGRTPSDLDTLTSRDSGLAGVSGTSGDMKALLGARHTDHDAGLAVEMFCYQVRKQIGALAAALHGLDTIVFTGGIGERAPEVRREVCDGLGHLGVTIDDEANATNADIISATAGRVAVRVVRTNENTVVARATRRLLEDPA